MGRYKPPASPAEAAERDAARGAKLEQLHATLAEQVGAIRNGQDWQRWLDVAATFPSYSLNNLLLIAAQRPDATAVAGFGAWKALGRQVDKGSKGIAILAPMVRRPGRADQAGEAGAASSEAGAERTAGGSPTSEAIAAVSPTGGATPGRSAGRRGVGGFKVVHVFDVSQTSGTPLPERPRPVLLAGQAPEGLWDALAGQVEARGFGLKRGDCGGGANGLTHYIDRTVTVRADVDDAQAVKTLAHELGHVLLHDPTGLGTVTTPGMALATGDPVLTPETVDTWAGRCRGRLEVEAESVAYLVASAHGLDTGAYTFAYVAGWAFEVAGVDVDQVVRGTANRVLAAAKVVLAGTEHLLEQDGNGQGLDQDLTLQVHAARGAQRTAALLTDAAATAGDVQRLAALATAALAPVATPATGAAALGELPAPGQDGPARERLVEIHALAVDFYAERLHAGGPDARRAVTLLTERGVDRDTAGAARLGYAPRAWTSLVDHLRKVGVDDVELRASGLVLESSRKTLVDRFRDRVIFPVDRLDGQTVALLGRAVDETATDRNGAPIPKYLNSPVTAIYSKGEHLYGLGSAAAEAIAAGAQPVLVEGPMDVLAVNRAAAALVSGGQVHFGVAPCGTALTGQQVQLLDTVTGGLAGRGVITAFDGDEAGRQASVRAYELLTAARAWPSAMDLPAGQDPASLATEHGTRGLNAALQASAGKPLVDLVVDERIDRHHLRWPEGQVAAGRDAAAVVAGLPAEHVHRQIVRVIGRTGLDPRTVSDLVVDAVTTPSRSHGNGGTGSRHGAADTDAAAQAPETARPLEPAAVEPVRAVGTGGRPAPPVVGPVRSAPAVAVAQTRAVATSSSQSAAQRARAGFPVALNASLRPPVPAQVGASPPAVTAATPAPDQQRSRSA